MTVHVGDVFFSTGTIYRVVAIRDGLCDTQVRRPGQDRWAPFVGPRVSPEQLLRLERLNASARDD